MSVEWTSVARVAAVAQVAVGFFKYSPREGKITEPRVAFFWATFIIYPAAQSVYRQIKLK